MREYEHHHKRQMGMLRPVPEEVARPHIAGQGLAGAVLGCWQRILWIGRAGQEAVFLLPLSRDLLLVDERNGDRFVRTGLHARRCFSYSKPARAHVALADNAPFL